ncbi:caspase family protein [Bradyrhizobium sp.]|uniref:caspase family protein n=1 Tax=Bradyrhizobium sp. TaxID=376 RepID=UPI0027200B4B|nr:caspase family protein [Bradyrhizobium sp.]MDO9298857.1 caspase family protein [Bradyrhizobium sp.]
MLASLFATAFPALADKRVALVIGNSAYQSAPKLSNPANDSEAMSGTFKAAGFDVVEFKRDLKASEMRRALRDFSDTVRDADVAIIYFAGHGIEIDGTNYLVPSDAVLERDIDAFDEAIPLERLLSVIEPAKKLRLIILDACRDNPFAKSMRRTVASRNIGRGLAKVEPGSPNTLIAYAAKAGSTALDGDGRNSPFTAALVKHLPKPGLDLRKAFGFTRDEVLKVTNNKQEPFIYGSLGGEDFALVPPPAVQRDPAQAVRGDYELAERVGTREAWDSFIATYPDGLYAKLAGAQRNKLVAEQSRLAAVEKARRLQEEQARLEAESARASAEAKAASDARAAEETRIAAEKRKALEQAKLAEAQRAKEKSVEEGRLTAERRSKLENEKAAEAERARLEKAARTAEDARIAAENARVAAEAKTMRQKLASERERLLAEAKAAEDARIRAEAAAKAAEQARAAAAKLAAAEEAKAARRLDEKPTELAALALPGQAADGAGAPSLNPDLVKSLQAQLRKVGCSTASATGEWSAPDQRALALYNKNANTRFDTRVASLDALQSLRDQTTRICPLICERGFKIDGDFCVKITCKEGYELSTNNSCERVIVKKRKKESPGVESGPARARPPALTTQPAPAQTKPNTSQSVGAIYSKCRAQAMAAGHGGAGRDRSGANFGRIDACIRNGGRI